MIRRAALRCLGLLLGGLCLLASASLHHPPLVQLFCEAYSECVAVSRLEERLCTGNSRSFPYWLPSEHDPKGCHATLTSRYRLVSVLRRKC